MPMTKTFTQNDLIRFIYRETTEEETGEISRVLAADPELSRQYRELVMTTKGLEKAMLQPSEKSVASIMDHVRGLAVKS